MSVSALLWKKWRRAVSQRHHRPDAPAWLRARIVASAVWARCRASLISCGDAMSLSFLLLLLLLLLLLTAASAASRAASCSSSQSSSIVRISTAFSQSVALSCWLRKNTVVVESETALGSALQWNPNEDGARGERRPSAARGEASERRNPFKPRLRRPLRASKRWNGLLERVENW